MIKTIPNRTIGLQKKEINDKVTESDCSLCNGVGHTITNVSTARIKNLKASANFLSVENECSECKGTGKTHATVRVIKKKQVTAIV